MRDNGGFFLYNNTRLSEFHNYGTLYNDNQCNNPRKDIVYQETSTISVHDMCLPWQKA